MSPSGLGDDVERFVTEHIHSVEQLEVLLLLQRTSPEEWTAPRVAAELRTTPASAASRLADLTGRRLLAVKEGAEPTYAYAPATPALDEGVIALGRAYTERRIAVINVIFAKPTEKFEAMRAFADAFRIRKKDSSTRW